METPPSLPESQTLFPASKPHEGIIPTKKKVLFWVILAILSVILAEVTCFSSPFPFFDGWGLLCVLPLYGLHTLFLAGLIFRNKNISLPILLLSGLLFGLYEALITKVLWDPTWGDKTTMIAGIAGLQTSVLILFWHPWFAFIFPLFFAEKVFTSTNEIQSTLPVFIKKCLERPMGKTLCLGLLAFYFGANQGTNSTSVEATLVSTIEALGVFLLFSWIWKWTSRKTTWTLRELLPHGRELVAIGVLLALLYGLSLPLIRPEALPDKVGPYITIFVLYVFSILLLVINLSKAKRVETQPPALPKRFPWSFIMFFVAIYLSSSLLFMNFRPIAQVLILAGWIIGILFGLGIFIRSIFVSVVAH